MVDKNIERILGIETTKSEGKTISKTVKNEVLFQQDYKCYECKNKLPARKHFHHIKPVSEGGDNSMGNIVAVCSNCHDEIHHRKQLLKQREGSSQGESKSIWDKTIDDLF